MKQAEANSFSFIKPMKALPVRDLPAGDWLYEMKFDGYRALAFKAGKEKAIETRKEGAPVLGRAKVLLHPFGESAMIMPPASLAGWRNYPAVVGCSDRFSHHYRISIPS